MPGNGVLFALSPGENQRLLAIPEARARAAWVAHEIEERWDRDWLIETDDLWSPVHYCLWGSADYPPDGAPAEAKLIFGGMAAGVTGHYTIDYKDPELVRQIASALAKMRDDALWARAGLIERDGYAGRKGIEIQSDIVHTVHALKDFYRKAADAARAVIFTVDV